MCQINFSELSGAKKMKILPLLLFFLIGLFNVIPRGYVQVSQVWGERTTERVTFRSPDSSLRKDATEVAVFRAGF